MDMSMSARQSNKVVGDLLAGTNYPVSLQEALAGNDGNMCLEGATEGYHTLTEQNGFTLEESPKGFTGVDSRWILITRRMWKDLS